ncbi:MAG: amidophosphoribosyltransferase [candidate division WOR-3 bacterium]|nr:amidophosphoribosyltransferase [candidate division WOR-3 bacterium]
MCGIFAVINSDKTFLDVYRGLKMIQHRGQDSCGIGTYDNKFIIKKNQGLVGNSFSPSDMNLLTGKIGIGHVRYPTIGSGGVVNAQPLFTNTPHGIIMAHNGNVFNYHELKNKLQKQYKRYINTEVDVEIILNLFAYYLSETGKTDFDAVCSAAGRVFEEVKGSYSVIAYIADVGFVSFRDPRGFRPLIYGEKNGKYAFSSESVSLDIIGMENYRDVRPGEVIFINNSNELHSRVIAGQKRSSCIFEWVYFARPDSTIDSINVYKARLRLGEKLADEIADKAGNFDVCMPVPDTSRTAALACAGRLGIPYREGLIKNRYIGRTFIMPGSTDRMNAVREKLNPIKAEIENKRILLIDDSIVRGNTSKSIVQIVRNAGAEEVHFAVYSPPLRYPCYFGIDMQRSEEFIANKIELEDIKNEINADSLHYLSIEGLIEGVGADNPLGFCNACFSGNYPVNVDEEHIKNIESDRNMSA